MTPENTETSDRLTYATADLFQAEIARLQAEIERLRRIIDATHPYAYAALEQLAALDEELGLPRTPNPHATPAECTVPTEWTSKPYWVDPPSGWRYGFPKVYDPASDGDMTAWMIRNGYPEELARQGLACTFTACTEDGGM